MRSLIFAVDVEPDGATSIRNDALSGTKIAIRELAALRSQIEESSQVPARFNWFFRFDPQVEQTWGRSAWLEKACPNLVPALQQRGDFTGIHTHFSKRDERRGAWFNDFADHNWRAHCLNSAIAGYQSVFGARPVASRFGDRWLSDELITQLRKEGIRYDLTLEPGRPAQPCAGDGYASAWLPDYDEAPRTPYQPSSYNYLEPEATSGKSASGNPLWLIPLTTTYPQKWGLVRRFPYLMKVSQPFNLVLRPKTLWQHLAFEIERECPEPLVLVLRSGDLANPRFLQIFIL